MFMQIVDAVIETICMIGYLFLIIILLPIVVVYYFIKNLIFSVKNKKKEQNDKINTDS